MASTRLSNLLREGIATRILAHRFGAEVESLSAEYAALAAAFYEDINPKAQREKMRRLPPGWLPESGCISVQAGAQYRSLFFSGRVRNAELRALIAGKELVNAPARRFLNRHQSSIHKYAATHPLAIALDKLENKEKSLAEQVRTAKTQLRTTLLRATTVEALVKLWPEVAPFVARTAAGTASPKTLPALPLQELNARFNLPVTSRKSRVSA